MRIPRSDFQRSTFDLIDWVHQFILPSNRRIELIPYLQTAPGNRLYINDTRYDGLHTSSSTPQSINWKVPDEYRNRTADDLLKAAIGSFIETSQDNFEQSFKELVGKYDNFSFRFYLGSVLGWPTELIDFVETVPDEPVCS
jgi:hypothetical protein